MVKGSIIDAVPSKSSRTFGLGQVSQT